MYMEAAEMREWVNRILIVCGFVVGLVGALLIVCGFGVFAGSFGECPLYYTPLLFGAGIGLLTAGMWIGEHGIG